MPDYATMKVMPSGRRKMTREQLQAIRLMAVQAIVVKGKRPSDIGKLVERETGIQKRRVYDWLKTYKAVKTSTKSHREAVRALESKKASGRKPKVEDQKLRAAFRECSTKMPSDFGLSFPTWTNGAFQAFFEKRFRI